MRQKEVQWASLETPRLWPAFSPLLPHWIPWVRSPLCTLAHAVLHLECPSILPAPQECVLIFQYPAQMEAWLDSQAASLLCVLPQHCLKAWVTAHILCCNYFLNVWQAPPPVNQAPVLIILITRNRVGCLVGLPSSVYRQGGHRSGGQSADSDFTTLWGNDFSLPLFPHL